MRWRGSRFKIIEDLDFIIIAELLFDLMICNNVSYSLEVPNRNTKLKIKKN